MGSTRDKRRRFVAWLAAALVALPIVLAGPAAAPAGAVAGEGVLTLTKGVAGQADYADVRRRRDLLLHAPPWLLQRRRARLRGRPAAGSPACPDRARPGALPQVTVSGAGTTYTVDTTGGITDVSFTQPLGGGDVGLQDGEEVVATINVRVPPDASTDNNGTVTNTARATQSNGDPRTSSTPVLIDVEQTWSPRSPSRWTHPEAPR